VTAPDVDPEVQSALAVLARRGWAVEVQNAYGIKITDAETPVSTIETVYGPGGTHYSKIVVSQDWTPRGAS
jgi:hypothetical protein